MGFMHINNLYKDQRVLLFKEVFALEKVHGTSAHIGWSATADAQAGPCYFSGGESHERFRALFDHEILRSGFLALGHAGVTVYGEAYGGKQQGMKATYGSDLRFIVFDVQVGESWLSVPDMEQVATGLGLEVVPYVRVPAEIGALDVERDRPSEVAVRRGMGGDRPREGVVLRPLVEMRCNNGERVIAKHKRDDFSERATPQKVVDPSKLEVLAAADAIAQEWVSAMRLAHVLDKIPGAGIEAMPVVIRAMVEDVEREAAGEIVVSKEARAAIGKRTAQLFKERLQMRLHEGG